MKSRGTRKQEAQGAGLWVLAVIAGLLLLYVLVTGTPTWVGALTPLLAAAAALSGVYLGSRLAQRQRVEEDTRKRRALATLLLHELRLLQIVLQDIHDSLEKEGEGVEPFQTGLYDQAGPELLRLTPATVDQLVPFYQLVHTLQVELHHYRHIPRGARAWHDAALKVRARQAAEHISEVARLLVKEGGIWPRPFPTIPMYSFPPEGPPFPAPTFEVHGSGRQAGVSSARQTFNLVEGHGGEP